MISTINERLRTNTKILISKDKNGISNILFALRSVKGPDGKSAFEKQNGIKPNKEKSRMIEKCVLEQDPQIEIEPEDFSEEADSTKLVRERVRGTKLEGAFKKVKGKIVGESSHTVIVVPKTWHHVVYSKRDVASGEHQASSRKQPSPSKRPNANKASKSKREANEAKEAKANKIAKKLKTAVKPDMGTTPKQNPQQPEEEELQISPIKIERNPQPASPKRASFN